MNTRSGRERVWGEGGWQDGAETCSSGRGDVSNHCCLSNFGANMHNISFTRPSCGAALPGFSRARLPTQALHCGIRRETTKFSSLRCQKTQALICKARRPYQKPSYLQGSGAMSKRLPPMPLFLLFPHLPTLPFVY